jgi:hypothetical protein
LFDICLCDYGLALKEKKTIKLQHKIMCISNEKIAKTYVRNASELCE